MLTNRTETQNKPIKLATNTVKYTGRLKIKSKNMWDIFQNFKYPPGKSGIQLGNLEGGDFLKKFL